MKHTEWKPPVAVLDLALRVCEQVMYFQSDSFLDGMPDGGSEGGSPAPDLAPAEWEALLQYSYAQFAPMPLAPVPPPKRDLAAPARRPPEDDGGASAALRYDAQAFAVAAQGAALLASWTGGPAAVAAPAAHTARAKAVVEFFATWDPQFEVSGFHNLWVIKPGAKSRGRDGPAYLNNPPTTMLPKDPKPHRN